MIQPHAVPQNILDVEFKLFGSLTIKQFAYVAGAVMICFLCYAIFSANSIGIQLLRWVSVSFLGILGLMLAFYKVNERSFDTWLTNYIVALFRTQKSIYVKSRKSLDIFDTSDGKNSDIPVNTLKSSINDYKAIVSGTSDIELANRVKSDLDKLEEDRLDRIDVLFANTFTSLPVAPQEHDRKIDLTDSSKGMINVMSVKPATMVSNAQAASFIQNYKSNTGFIQRFADKRQNNANTRQVGIRDMLQDDVKPQDLEILKRNIDIQPVTVSKNAEDIDPILVMKLREQLAKSMQAKDRKIKV